MAEVKRYTASVMHPGVREDPEGLLVAFEHLQKAKAALLGAQHLVTYLKQELEETKRERDQLAGIGIQCGCGEASCTTDADNLHQALCEIRQLKDKLERLTKAGDAMADSINGDYNYSLPCIEAWKAAKEGKPKNSKDALEFIHTLDSLAIKKQKEEIERLCAWGRGLESDLSHARVEISFLKAESERLKEDNRQLTNAFEIAEGIIKRMGKAAEAAAKEGKQFND